MQLSEQTRVLEARAEATAGVAGELHDYCRRRADLEHEYARALDKLARTAAQRHKDQKHKYVSVRSTLSHTPAAQYMHPLAPPQARAVVADGRVRVLAGGAGHDARAVARPRGAGRAVRRAAGGAAAAGR